MNFAGIGVKIDKMAERDRKTDTPKSSFERPRRTQGKPDVLRAKDIIPTASQPSGEDEGVNQIDIPQFDLAEDIMAEQRRQIAIRRKGPGGPTPMPVEKPQPFSQRREDKTLERELETVRWIETTPDPIIADIVARDIAQFCGSAY